MTTWSIVTVALTLLGFCHGQGQGQRPVVATQYGLVQGLQDQGVVTFMGIPFASAARFEDPRAPQAWTGLRDASSAGPQCPQSCTTSLARYACVGQESEDCLSLNVFAPERQSTQLLPVMVWFHGGNFEFGSGGALLYNGAFLARVGSVVVVSSNYRLGSLGYLPVLDNATGQMEGNWGLKDQIAALQWVRDNIHAFGGNPNLVTIFGQSAGGQSVGAILTSLVTESLYDRAIMQSAPITLPFRNTKDAQVLAEAFAKEINCPVNDLDCYRQRPAELLVSKQKAVRGAFSYKAALTSQPWGPLVDGRLVTSSLADAFAAGRFHRKPLMLGYTTEEGLTYAKQLSKDPLLAGVYRVMLSMLLPGDTGRRASEGPYRPVNDQDARPELSRAITDLVFACPARWVARVASEARVPSYLYVFDQPLSMRGIWGDPLCEGHTCHAVELPFLFNTPALAGLPVSVEDNRLSYDMARRWTRFAWTGDPNESEFVAGKSWPGFQQMAPAPETSKMAYVFRHGTSGAQSGHLDRYCNFWDEMGYTALEGPRVTSSTSTPAPPNLGPSQSPLNSGPPPFLRAGSPPFQSSFFPSQVPPRSLPNQFQQSSFLNSLTPGSQTPVFQSGFAPSQVPPRSPPMQFQQSSFLNSMLTPGSQAPMFQSGFAPSQVPPRSPSTQLQQNSFLTSLFAPGRQAPVFSRPAGSSQPGTGNSWLPTNTPVFGRFGMGGAGPSFQGQFPGSPFSSPGRG